MGEVQEQSGAHPNVVEADRSNSCVDDLGAGEKVAGQTATKPSQIDGQKLRRSFGFAWAGVAQTWRSEQNFRVEVVVGVFALVLGTFLQADLVPIILCCLTVLSLEIVNSALESAINLVSPEFHPLAKRAKDAAAGAVLLAATGSVFVGCLVLGPPLWRAIFG